MEWVKPLLGHMTAALEDGNTQEWMLEGGTPNTLLRAGRPRQFCGRVPRLSTRIPKQGSGLYSRAEAAVVFLPDGRNIFKGSSGVGAPPSVRR